MKAGGMDHNLLLLSHSYSTFVKDSVDRCAPYFKKINVLVRVNPIAEVSRFIPIDYLRPYTAGAKIDTAGRPDNLNVLPTPIVYTPTGIGYRLLPDRHFKKCDRVLRDNKVDYDLIHAHFLVTSGYAGAKLKEKYNVPLVVTAHGYDIYEVPFRDSAWKEKVSYVLNTADHIVTVSNRNHDCIKQLGIDRPVSVIPNGFDHRLFRRMDRSACRRALDLPQDKKILLNIGNLMAEKGQKYLIDAVRELYTTEKDILCIVIGSGELMGDLQRRIDRYGLSSCIRLIGRASHREIPLWINSCDLFVLSSIAEGNPTVMFECLGCGIPFIGTRVGGVPDVITSDAYGLIADPGDAGDLAEKIRAGLGRAWDREAILRCSERYTWDVVTNELLGVYGQVLS